MLDDSVFSYDDVYFLQSSNKVYARVESRACHSVSFSVGSFVRLLYRARYLLYKGIWNLNYFLLWNAYDGKGQYVLSPLTFLCFVSLVFFVFREDRGFVRFLFTISVRLFVYSVGLHLRQFLLALRLGVSLRTPMFFQGGHVSLVFSIASSAGHGELCTPHAWTSLSFYPRGQTSNVACRAIGRASYLLYVCRVRVRISNLFS